tara:strand:+ start:275 stop:850 length:576 start_codon:yes stop_codon:yes gene_type:complete
MKVLFVLLITFYSINCANQNENGEFPNLEFRCDKSLLSLSQVFKEVSLSIPLGFNQIVGNDFSRIENNLENIENSFFETDILSSFQNDNGGAIIISQIKSENPIIKKLDKEFESSLIQSSNVSDTNKGQFLINGIETVQYITKKGDIINYKLFFNVMHDKCYQIDYFVLFNNFVKFQKALESSISTLKINN